MNDPISTPSFKRNIAYKLRIGQILQGSPIIEAERLQHLKVDGKEVIRVNVIANIIEKFIQDEEKKFGSITLDDASGQIRVKAFGDDLSKFDNFGQGDTVLVIGMVRSWNNELYITPEIIKKISPSYLLLRKLEIEAEMPKSQNPEKAKELKDRIIDLVKSSDSNGGVEVEKIILESKEHPDLINSEIKKLLEEGLVYEPRPGRLRYLG
jgi:RPA family protein